MIKDTPHFTSKLDGPIREAHRALRAITPSTTMTTEDNEYLAHVVDDLDMLYRLANEAIKPNGAHECPGLEASGTVRNSHDWSS